MILSLKNTNTITICWRTLESPQFNHRILWIFLNEFSQNKIQYFFSKLKFEYISKKQNGVLLENKKTNKMAMLE